MLDWLCAPTEFVLNNFFWEQFGFLQSTLKYKLLGVYIVHPGEWVLLNSKDFQVHGLGVSVRLSVCLSVCLCVHDRKTKIEMCVCLLAFLLLLLLILLYKESGLEEADL